MKIERDNGKASTPPEANFTGDVKIIGYFQREAPSKLAGARVTFAPGARTPWKLNPLGQTLVVMSGAGWVQCEGENIVEVQAGDVVWCPPGRRHWDGGTPDQGMTYIAMHETGDGGSVKFLEAVTDDEYQRGPRR